MKMRVTRNFCILAALLPASILLQQYMVSKHRRAIVPSEDDNYVESNSQSAEINGGDDVQPPVSMDTRIDANNPPEEHVDVKQYFTTASPGQKKVDENEPKEYDNPNKYLIDEKPEVKPTLIEHGEHDTSAEHQLEPQDLEDDDDYKAHSLTVQKMHETEPRPQPVQNVPQAVSHEHPAAANPPVIHRDHLADMTDQDNKWITVVPPAVNIPVTDLEEDLNALFPKDQVIEFEEDDSWMWESSGRDDPCRVCLAPVHSRPLVALASAPGSGNTWARSLLEKATGIYTGSVYRDRRLFYGGFHGEMVDYSYKNTLIVKTHARGELASKEFEKAIVLIRNPFDMIVGELHRVYSANHSVINSADDIFHHPDWKKHVYHRLEWWQGVPEVWLASGKPVMFVHYEDLLDDPVKEVKRMVEYLGLQFDDSRADCIKQGINTRLPVTDSDYKQDVKVNIFRGLDSEMKSKIHEKLDIVSKKLREKGHPEVVRKSMFE
ncbi:uncharacterized protein LOC100368559 [Saccoglossus kowalevskii]|uniref:Uncharacterized protein LOC100368559 n=1 Tax=Saccoglossus kowalevskii TaxID=10224 RepID=A0ABM0GKM9_SACKO|nr:PREDICTED: uncharacterized protein LOC100368559 [Saccoglossus kowalevskii]